MVRSFGGEVWSSAFKAVSLSNTNKQLRMTRTGAIYTLLQLVIYEGHGSVDVWSCTFAVMRRRVTWSPTSRWPACCPSQSASCPKSARPSRKAWP